MAVGDLVPCRRNSSSTPALWPDDDLAPLASFRRDGPAVRDFFRTPALSGFGSGLTASWPSIDIQDKDNG